LSSSGIADTGGADQATRAAFHRIAAADGMAIENVVTEVYRTISASWPAPRPVLDGGCHFGIHTLPMSDLLNISQVIAVEANAKTYEGFARSLATAANGYKVEHVFAALQDQPHVESVSFVTSPSHPGRSGIKPIMALYDKATQFEAPVTVPATTVDKLFADQSRDCGFIKLDLEGSEFAAMRGGARTVSRSRPVIVFENGPDAPAHGNYHADDLLGFLRSIGMIAMTTYGDVMTPQNMRDFWYGWALPAADFNPIRESILAAVRNRTARAGA
jgi:FkbM family methyltransferase